MVLLASFWPTNSKTTTPDNQDTSENMTATDNQNTTGDTSRVIPVGKNLAFVTSEKTVVLIDKELKEVASFSTEA